MLQAEDVAAQRDTRDIVSAFFLPFYTSFVSSVSGSS